MMKPQKCCIVRFATGCGENSLVFKIVFFVFFNMAKFCQILTLFTQVMTSEANGTNYDGYRGQYFPVSRNKSNVFLWQYQLLFYYLSCLTIVRLVAG